MSSDIEFPYIISSLLPSKYKIFEFINIRLVKSRFLYKQLSSQECIQHKEQVTIFS